MNKYLLTGGSGILGTELQKYLDCWAPSHDEFNIICGATELSQELTTIEHDLVKKAKAIIHCAAYTNVPGAEQNKKAVVEANIIGTRNIVNFARRYGRRVIYISTDYVYDGCGYPEGYKETGKTNPINFYGFTKLAAEVFLDSKKDLIIRTSFKPNDLWKTKYNSAFIDLYTSSDYVDVIAKDIILAIENNLTGIINIGTERKSIYELATRRRSKYIQKISINDIKDVKMPSDISMNIDKFLDFKKRILEEKNERR